MMKQGRRHNSSHPSHFASVIRSPSFVQCYDTTKFIFIFYMLAFVFFRGRLYVILTMRPRITSLLERFLLVFCALSLPLVLDIETI
mmetsp:Transcript_42145/g.127866  ORF Transcript_42145/g.127866 Transcript_42145/m.127866 type:complete len:86 (-) Transcript_42145:24-281(-)